MSGQSGGGESGDGGQDLACGFGPPKGFRLLIVDPNELPDRFFQLTEFFGKCPYELTLRRLAEMLQPDQAHFRGHVTNIGEV